MTHNEEPFVATRQPPASLIFLLALACGIAVANIYYVQPLVGVISRDYGMATAEAGLLVTVTQLGYAAGLIVMVPLGDTLENRRLILVMLAALVAALIVIVGAPSGAVFLAASVVVGLMSSVVQVMVPYAGHLVPDETRGRTIGTVVSGLLFGIMASRPISSFAAHALGPRSIFALSAVAIVILIVALAIWLPRRQPRGMAYGRALLSLGPLLVDTPILRQRSFYQAALFGCFSVFWTAVPLLLEGAPFHFTQLGIGVFALVGAGGALVSPLAGRMADAGFGRRTTGLALAGAAASCLLAVAGGLMASWPLLVVAGVLLDMATAAHLVTGQRDIFALPAEARGRLNGLYLALFFAGGALGSFLAGVAFAHGGWTAACAVGLVFPLAGLVRFCFGPVPTTERKGP